MVLERDGQFFPIEVKLTTNRGRKDTSEINAFRKTYPGPKVAPGLVICPTGKLFPSTVTILRSPGTAVDVYVGALGGSALKNPVPAPPRKKP